MQTILQPEPTEQRRKSWTERLRRSKRSDYDDSNLRGRMGPPGDGSHSELGNRMRAVREFPKGWGFVDLHEKDSYPDSILAAYGSRYQLVQMLGMRDLGGRLNIGWIKDNHPIDYWLRTTANLRTSVGETGETQRMGLAPQPPLTPYQLEQWRGRYYQDTPRVGTGPGTAFVVPLSQVAD